MDTYANTITPNPVLVRDLRESLGFQQVKQPYIGPSNIFLSQFCEREYALQMKYRESATIPFETLLTFLSGDVAEDFVEMACKKAGIEILEKQINGIPVGELGVFTTPRGRSDLLVKLRNNDIALMEIKSMDPKRYETFRKFGHHSESAAHFQLLVYLKNIGHAPKYTHPLPDYGLIVGVQLAECDIFDDKVIYSDEILNKYLRRLSEMEYIIDQSGKYIPERPYDRTSPTCSSCTMYDKCWKPGDKVLDSNNLSNEDIENIKSIIEEILSLNAFISSANKVRTKYLQELDKILEIRDARKISIELENSSLIAEIQEYYDNVLYEKEFKEMYPEIYYEVAPLQFKSEINVYESDYETKSGDS